MECVRFLRTELQYGCHWEVAFEVPTKREPIVVAGPNGAGKTTLVEGLVRTLFGFSRRNQAERELLASRTPWRGEGCGGTVDLADRHDTRWRIERDFGSDAVVVRKLGSEGEVWRGDGNPSATNQEAVEFRRHLRKIFGISELEHYESTAFIAQGELRKTELRGGLLQVATGGYGNVDQALDRLQREHHALTVRAITRDEGPRRKPRRLEIIGAEIERLREGLAECEAVAAQRAPIQQQLDEDVTRCRQIETEIVELERALGPLHQREVIEARMTNARARHNTISKLRQRLDAATREIRSQNEAQRADLPAPKEEPRKMWVPSAWLASVVAGLLVLAGVAVWVLTGRLALAMIPAALGLVIWAWLSLWRLRRWRLADNAPPGRERIREEIARRQLQDLIAEGEETLELDNGEGHPKRIDSTPSVERGAEFLLSHAGILGDACDRELERCQVDIAKEELRLEDLATIEIPGGAEMSPQSAQAALEERRKNRIEVDESVRLLERRLLEEGSGQESVVALTDRLKVLEAELLEVQRSVRTYERAHALLLTAYEGFRAGDQRRLVNSISEALEFLTSGVIGPLEAVGTLSEAQVCIHGRSVDLVSPPLSYGELHAALLGVRLGASEFLARADVHPPLILDEPFAFLDPERAEKIWQFLCRIATERQVIMVTQEALILDALGISPDIELATSSWGTSMGPP